MEIKNAIEGLINYGLNQHLIEPSDTAYIRNQYYFMLNLDYEPIDSCKDQPVVEQYPDLLLANIYQYFIASECADIKFKMNQDMLYAQFMNVMTPRPSQVRQHFQLLEATQDIGTAIDYFYNLSVASNCIKLQSMQQNQTWRTQSKYAELEIIINLSRPERTSNEIVNDYYKASNSYPQCFLCLENEGYAGNNAKQSRLNHRVVPLTLNQETWFFQFSSYLCFDKHSLIFSAQHRDMVINRSTFATMFDYVDLLPEYFIGANTELPIIGGSILSHEHFHAGIHTFPIDSAKIRSNVLWQHYPKVIGYILEWPLSVIRLQGHRDELLNLANDILEQWLIYDDQSVQIISHSDTQHNSLNPIVRKLDENCYQLDLILRNNRCDQQYPAGIFHSHQQLHHIKKENIGLVEAMGMAILPGRLKTELGLVVNFILGKMNTINLQAGDCLYPHREWLNGLSTEYGHLDKLDLQQTIKNVIGEKFKQMLECAGVFKDTPLGNQAFNRFIQQISGNVERTSSK